MLKKIKELLKSREFISIATSNLEYKPNASSKFLLKLEDRFVYLADHVFGRTFNNLKVNPQVSISFADTNTLSGYQINGKAQILEEGEEYERILKEMRQKQIDLSTKRIIEGVTSGKTHKGFAISIPDKLVIFKVHIIEVIEVGSTGQLKKEKYE
jgi:predicted pyridoxine 5'-phosphate oxidase superfamily flavin-nucleotide-binding protein